MKDRLCVRCGLNMGRVGGFTLARDTVRLIKEGKAPVREFCEKCMWDHNPNVLAAFFPNKVILCAGCGKPISDERDCGCPAGTITVPKES